jgi:hypothetical protein
MKTATRTDRGLVPIGALVEHLFVQGADIMVGAVTLPAWQVLRYRLDNADTDWAAIPLATDCALAGILVFAEAAFVAECAPALEQALNLSPPSPRWVKGPDAGQQLLIAAHVQQADRAQLSRRWERIASGRAPGATRDFYKG